ncbi:MAG: CapA family protein [Bacteroidales bacterium]|nr:CapA family protein [Bacteroidales bacterium]
MRRFLILCIASCLTTLSLAQTFNSFPPARPLYHLPDTATILIMGDVMMHRDQITNARRSDGTYDFSTYLVNLKEMIESADVAVANMEFTLAGKPYTGYPCFSAPDGYEDYVADCGVDVFLTANNHILDKGKSGIERTLKRYSFMEGTRGIKHTGSSVSASDDAGRFPLYIVCKGARIALINFTYGTNTSIDSKFPKVHRTDTSEIGKAVRKAKSDGVDFIIALPHWGTEYVLKHSPSQEKLARWLASQGCDAIVGAHPHVVQDVGEVVVPNSGGIGSKSVPVVYSMGNVISNMSAVNTRIGLIVTLKIVTDLFGNKSLLEPELTLTWCTRPGTLTESYSTIPVKDFIGKSESWISKGDYDNMISSYNRVRSVTGIND